VDAVLAIGYLWYRFKNRTWKLKMLWEKFQDFTEKKRALKEKK